MKSLLLVTAACACSLVANAQLFSVDIKTVSSDLGSADASAGANRLFMDAGLTTRAPIGTTLWFVADTDRNGVNLSPVEGSILGADDQLVFADVVDGVSAGNQIGRYLKSGLSISDPSNDVRNADIWVYLWNGTGAGFTPVAGSTFGALNTGTFSVPAIGNGFWAIDGNVIASANTVSPVPEPEEYAALAALGLAGFAAWRRSRRSSNA